MAAPTLELRLLGQPALWLEGRSLRLPVPKVLALLAYLGIEGERSRSEVAGLLWANWPEAEARRNLRQRLYRLEPPELSRYVHSDEHRVWLSLAVNLDVQAFEQAVQNGQLERATSLYRGGLLQGFELEDSEEFGEWLHTQRHRLEALYKRVLAQQAVQYEQQGRLAEALQCHQQILQLDPLLELHQREAMRLCAALGERAQALEHYERWRGLLMRELGLEPLPETTALAERIRLQTPGPAVHKPEITPPAPQLRSPLVGRHDALAQLEEVWQQGKIALIQADAGTGKSRLLQEFATTKRALFTMGRPSDTQVPFATQTRVLRKLLEQQPNLILPAWIRRELSRLLPALADDEPPASSPESRLRLFEAFAELVWLVAAEHDTFVADDLHFFDPDSFEMGMHVYERFADNPANKRHVLAYRPHELAPAVAQSLERSVQVGSAVRLELSQLSEEAVRQLVQNLFGAAEPVLFSRRLYRSTGGNALFVLETLKGLVESGTLRQSPEGVWETPYDQNTLDYAELPIPPSVREAIRERVERLGGGVRRLLEAASLAEDGFGLALLQDTLALTDFEALEALEQAQSAKLLLPLGHGYVFAHDLIRETLAQSLSPERRRLLHARMARSLETQGGAAATIAQHLEQAQQNQQAVAWRIQAAQNAFDLYAYREALQQLDLAQANGPNQEQSKELLLLRSRAGLLLSDGESFAQSQAQLLALAQKSQDRLLAKRAKLLDVRWHYFQYRYDLAISEVEEVWQDLESLNPPSDLILEAHSDFGLCLTQAGRYQEAIGHYQKARAIAAQVSPIKAIETTVRMADPLMQMGNLQQAHQLLSQELPVLERPGLEHMQTIALTSLARLERLRRRSDVTIQHLEQALELSRRIRHLRLQRSILSNLALVYTEQGELQKAEQRAQEGLELAQLTKDPGSTLNFQHRLVDLYTAQGKLGLALKGHAQVSAGYGEGAVAQALRSDYSQVRLYIQLGAWPLAEQSLLALQDKVSKTNTPRMQHGYRMEWARLYLAQGHFGLAVTELENLLQNKDELDPVQREDIQVMLVNSWLEVGQVQAAQETLKALSKSGAETQVRLFAVRLRLAAPSEQAALINEIHAFRQGRFIPPLVELPLLNLLYQMQPSSTLQQQREAVVLLLASSLQDYPNIQQCFLQLYPPQTTTL